MKPEVSRIWFNRSVRKDIPHEFRLDWDNDRHHGVKINPPYDRDEVVKALRTMAVLIDNDHNLD